MAFVLRIETGNAAFHDEETGEWEPHRELQIILTSVIGQLQDPTNYDGRVRDTNGNMVAKWELDQE